MKHTVTLKHMTKIIVTLVTLLVISTTLHAGYTNETEPVEAGINHYELTSEYEAIEDSDVLEQEVEETPPLEQDLTGEEAEFIDRGYGNLLLPNEPEGQAESPNIEKDSCVIMSSGGSGSGQPDLPDPYITPLSDDVFCDPDNAIPYARPGDFIQYRLRVWNPADGEVVDVTVIDQLDTSLVALFPESLTVLRNGAQLVRGVDYEIDETSLTAGRIEVELFDIPVNSVTEVVFVVRILELFEMTSNDAFWHTLLHSNVSLDAEDLCPPIYAPSYIVNQATLHQPDGPPIDCDDERIPVVIDIDFIKIGEEPAPTEPTEPIETTAPTEPLVNFEFRKVLEDRNPSPCGGLPPVTPPLEGAVFHLYRQNLVAGQWEATPIAREVSGADGWVRFEGLRPGEDYRLVEVQAPEGFITPRGHWVVRVDADGNVTTQAVRGTTGINTLDFQPGFIDRGTHLCLPNRFGDDSGPGGGGDIATPFNETSFTRRNTGRSESFSSTQTTLSGAIFYLYAWNANTEGWEADPIAIIESGVDGRVRFEGLRLGGGYRLVEVEAPDGFMTPRGYWIVEVSNRGVVTFTPVGEGQPEFIDRDGILLLPNDREGQPTTTPEETTAPTTNPTETTVPSSSTAPTDPTEPTGNTVPGTGPTNPTQPTTGPDDDVDLEFVKVGTIPTTPTEPVTEPTEPAPTIPNPTEPCDWWNWWDCNDDYEPMDPCDWEDPDCWEGNSISFHLRNLITLLSERSVETPLQGATFHLYRLDAEGERTTPPTIVTSGLDGSVRFEGLRRGGVYHLVEVNAPSGYVTPNGYWIIRIAEDGTFTIEAVGEGQPEFIDRDGNLLLPNEPDEEPEPTTVPEETTTPETTVPEDTQPVITDPSEPTTVPETTVPPTTDPVETTTPETTVPATTEPTDPTGTTATTEPTGTTAPGTDPSEPTTALPTDPEPLEDPELMKEVCALEPADSLVEVIRQLVDCGFGDIAEAEVGQSARYRLTISNPNDVALEDILVVDTLDLNLVEFVGNVMINGIVAVSPEDYTFNVTTGELRVYLSELPIDGAVITFDVIVLAGNENDEIPNVAYLFGPEDENGDREPINEDDALIIVNEEEPQPTTIPEETTVPTTTDPTEAETTVPVTTNPSEPTTVPETTVPPTTDPSEPTTVPATTEPEPTTVPATTTPTDPSEPTTAPATTAPTEPDLVDPTLEKEVCVLEEADSLIDLIRQTLSCTFDNEADAEVGQTLRYQLTVSNPNNIALEDFVVIDILDIDLVEFIGNVRINGELVSSPGDYTFNEITGELRVYLSVLSANGTYRITFDVIVLAGNEANEIPNTAYLYGSEDEETGNRDRITEDDALVNVEEDPEPTDPTEPTTTDPEETTAPQETTTPSEPEETTSPEETQPITTDPSEPTETDPEETTSPQETTIPSEPEETTSPEETQPITADPSEPTDPETTQPDPVVCIEGQTMVILPPGVGPDDIQVEASPGWTYEFVRDTTGQYVILVTPPVVGYLPDDEVIIIFPPGVRPDEVIVCLADTDWEYEVDGPTVVIRPPANLPEEDCPLDEPDCDTNTSGGGPSLPQTGAIVGSSLLGGIGLTAAGLALTSKMFKKDE